MRAIRIPILLLIAALVVQPLLPGDGARAAFVLRTWTTPAAAPADGDPVSGSPSFTLRARMGGPFAGYASSSSFELWGCSAYTDVEAVLLATVEADELCVTLRWTYELAGGIDGFNIYRATKAEGPFTRINDEMLPPTLPGVYEDRSVWPGSHFWYELWAVMADGSEEKLPHDPVEVVTDGRLVTKLYAMSPNPFRQETVIVHDLAAVHEDVRLVVYDVAGRVVKTFDDRRDAPGRYSVVWDGRNDQGQKVASGVYFCCLEAAGVRDVRPVVLLR